jgi:hypothetical protein
MMIDIEFVTASHDKAMLEAQLMRSPIFKNWEYAVTIIEGYSNIPKAYHAFDRKSKLTCYIHHDVFLPGSFIIDLKKALERVPDDWAVIGVAGVKLVDGKKEFKGYVNDRGKIIGSPWKLPAEVDTLDELLLITRGDLVFDEQLEQDFYGADICMQAKQQGRKCYAINAYCEHNSCRSFGGRTESFYESEKKFREKWKSQLPIATTCSIVR